MFKCSICETNIKKGRKVDVIMRGVEVIDEESGQTILCDRSSLEFVHHDCAAAERAHATPPARTEGT